MELEKNFEFFETVREKLIEERYGQYAIISNGAIVSFHETSTDAAIEARKKFKPGFFVVKKCVPVGEEDYSVFHSRVGV